MPLNPSERVVLVDASSYCSAPPLATFSRILLPPRPTRAEEACRPHAPLRAINAEVRESEAESVEFVFEDEEEKAKDVKPKIELDPHQLSARVAAISIWQPSSAASASSGEERDGTQPPCRVPPSQLGPVDLPQRPGRPKGSKRGRKSRRSRTCQSRQSAQQRPEPPKVWLRRRVGLRGALRQSPSGRPPVPKRRSDP